MRETALIRQFLSGEDKGRVFIYANQVGAHIDVHVSAVPLSSAAGSLLESAEVDFSNPAAWKKLVKEYDRDDVKDEALRRLRERLPQHSCSLCHKELALCDWSVHVSSDHESFCPSCWEKAKPDLAEGAVWEVTEL